MVYLSVEQISKQYPEQLLFQNLTFSITKGDKIALVANNGAGKSSLIKIIAGVESPDEGGVSMRQGLRVGYLAQDPQFAEDWTIQACIEKAHAKVLKVIHDYYAALSQTDLTRQEDTAALMDHVGGWDYDRDLKAFLTRFGIHDTSLLVGQLSGGQKKRLAVAMALADKPELLIMDEPTNHLDIAMIEWLEKHLDQSNMSIFMVTHDRYFLDTVCNQILELADGKLYRHHGNYAYFLEKRVEREAIFDRGIVKANRLMKRELEWMRRTPQARTTKAKSRIGAFHELKEEATGKKSTDHLHLDVRMSRVGGKILELKVIRKSYGDRKLLDGFTYTFRKGDRVGIVGANGVGKSTLLNIMVGADQPDSGKVNVGQTTVFGYYHQDGLRIKPHMRIIDVLKNIAEHIVMSDGKKVSASQFLTHFMFPPKVQYKPVEKLSGGERRRLHLLTVLIKNPNFLILDEPTNDLDILTLNKLEEFLENYAGCLVLVSHDRYFMDKLVDHLFVFQGDGKIQGYNGTYTEYRLSHPSPLNAAISSGEKDANEKPRPKESVRRPSNREKNEFRKLEREIEQLEKEKSDIELALSGTNAQVSEIQELSHRIGEIIQLIESKTQRWMELAELF